MVTSKLSKSTNWLPEMLVAGHPVLELVNTVSNRTQVGTAVDRLQSCDDVVSWCQALGLITTSAQLPPAAGTNIDHLLRNIKQVREDIFSVFSAIAEGESPPRTTLSALFSRAGGTLKNTALSDLPTLLELDEKNVETLLQVIPGAFSVAAIEAVFKLPNKRIGACPACGWLFLDSSRGGKRRWCSMRVCGTRTKVAQYRERKI